MVVMMAVIVLCPLWLTGLLSLQSIDKQLARIEAARAIPDSENAGVIYDRLMDDYDAEEFSLTSPDGQPYSLIRSQLWKDKEYPEVAKWLEGCEALMASLLKASSMEECRFPIAYSVTTANIQMTRSKAIRRWAMVLAYSANNDAAEDRIRQALEKYFTLIQMGRHMRQQPGGTDFLLGIGLEATAFQAMRPAILQARLTDEHLQAIESMLTPVEDLWRRDSRYLARVERLLSMRGGGAGTMLQRLKMWWEYLRTGSPMINRVHEMYLRLLSDRRANHILIALRRQKDKTGQWATSLDEIKAIVPREALADPTNGDAFVYKPFPGGFRLNSKGPDGKDEKGIGKSDDRTIWPTRRSSTATLISPRTAR
jgi:hypothetical protein